VTVPWIPNSSVNLILSQPVLTVNPCHKGAHILELGEKKSYNATFPARDSVQRVIKGH